MLLRSLNRRVIVLPALILLILLGAGAACGMGGFGGGLQLNITDRQTRQLVIRIDGGASDARLLEIAASGEVEIGTGSASIERYVLQRATFGNGVAVGYFLCAKPCADPLASYVVAYSPDQIFDPTGELRLHFRVEADGGAEELTRSIDGAMLPGLWQSPRIEAAVGR